MTLQQIREEISRLIDIGDEKALERFAIERFSEFPEDIQKKVFFAVYTDALRKRAGKIEIEKLQTAGLDAMDKIEAFKASVSETA